MEDNVWKLKFLFCAQIYFARNRLPERTLQKSEGFSRLAYIIGPIYDESMFFPQQKYVFSKL